ncbi:MAG: PQQ-dependent dehydrogenase, methanol/ethanol family [Puniceicoccaceae bacterium]
MYRFYLFCLIASILSLELTAKIYDDQAIADEANTSEWLAYGRTHSEQRFSPLTDINVETVANLSVDWYLDLPNDVGLVATPLVVDGILYFVGTMNVVRAVDAVTGELLWEHDPKVAEAIAGKRQAGWVHNRGLSFSHGRIYAATWDGRLRALDYKTGELLWSVTTFNPNRALYITGTPKAFKDKVLIGNGGTENGPTRGWVTAYDAATGREAWKFYIVPGNPADGFENAAMEMAAETWTGEWWINGGGGNAWHGFTYDAELDTLYIGTGNGSPWNRKARSPDGGDNLFLCSIVALDPDTGEYRWHYQTTPGETWDYNSNMDIVLADLELHGKTIKAILHAPKNGFFYVIDRTTGKFVSAEPYVLTTWASHIDPETGRPVELPNARYEQGPAYITPSYAGSHSWPPMSHNPKTGLSYIPVINDALIYTDDGIELKGHRVEEFKGGMAVYISQAQPPRSHPSSLVAWDPVKQQQVWSVPQDTVFNGGTLTTAGNLVFQGESNGMFSAYDARDGSILWTFDAGLGIAAAPITYKIGDRQYVSVLVGWGGGISGLAAHTGPPGWTYGMHTRRLITFSLDGTAKVPKQPPPHFPKPLVFPGFIIDESKAKTGESLYYENGCHVCHSQDLVAGGMAPDLRASPMPLSDVTFRSIVRDGGSNVRGMPSYPELSDEELDALRHFIRMVAHRDADSSNK